MKKKNPAFTYGLLGAFILIIVGILTQMYLLSYIEKAATSDKAFSPLRLLGISILSLIILIGVFIFCIVKSIKEYKKFNADFTYKKLVGQGLTATLIIALLSTGFNFVYTNYIDTNAKEKGIEMMEQIYEKMEIPDDQKEAAIEQLNNQSPVRQFTTSLALTLIFGLIVSLISASVFNKRNVFPENPNQPTI